MSLYRARCLWAAGFWRELLRQGGDLVHTHTAPRCDACRGTVSALWLWPGGFLTVQQGPRESCWNQRASFCLPVPQAGSICPWEAPAFLQGSWCSSLSTFQGKKEKKPHRGKLRSWLMGVLSLQCHIIGLTHDVLFLCVFQIMHKQESGNSWV